MPTIGNLALNFNDLRKRQAPDGTIDHIIEVLKQSNPIMDDIKWKQGNLPTGNQTTQRTSIPTPSLRAINKGVQPTKSSTKQVRDTCCILEARSRVDIELLRLEPDPQAFRRSEDDAHIEGFSEKVASMIFYGDSDEKLDEFNGFAKRYDHLAVKKENTPTRSETQAARPMAPFPPSGLSDGATAFPAFTRSTATQALR